MFQPFDFKTTNNSHVVASSKAPLATGTVLNMWRGRLASRVVLSWPIALEVNAHVELVFPRDVRTTTEQASNKRKVASTSPSVLAATKCDATSSVTNALFRTNCCKRSPIAGVNSRCTLGALSCTSLRKAHSCRPCLKASGSALKAESTAMEDLIPEAFAG